MHLCFEQDPDVRPNACQVRDLVEELWYRNDIWDTSLQIYLNQRILSYYHLLLAKKEDTSSLKEYGCDFVVTVGQHNGFTDSPRVSKTFNFY